MHSIKYLQIIFTLLIAGFALIQLLPHVENTSSRSTGKEIATKFTVPPDVDAMLRASCYDCHSNNTVYPWYGHVQPVQWWLDQHISQGKRHLNFDEFASYRANRQYSSAI